MTIKLQARMVECGAGGGAHTRLVFPLSLMDLYNDMLGSLEVKHIPYPEVAIGTSPSPVTADNNPCVRLRRFCWARTASAET